MTEKQSYLIIGDQHSCYEELQDLINKSDFYKNRSRFILGLGDMCDRGPYPDKVLEFFMKLQKSGRGTSIMGNHCNKLYRWLKGNPVKIGQGLQGTIDALENRGDKFKSQVFKFLESLSYIYETDEFIAVHGAYKGEVGEKFRQNAALYGEIDGTRDKEGYPNRFEKWKHEYKGTKNVFHGHIAGKEVDIFKCESGAKIYNLDTGCCFGGHLSGLLVPEYKVISVKGKKVYCEH